MTWYTLSLRRNTWGDNSHQLYLARQNHCGWGTHSMDWISGPGGSGCAAAAAASAASWKAAGRASSALHRGQLQWKPRSRCSHSRRCASGWCARSGMYAAVTSSPAVPGAWILQYTVRSHSCPACPFQVTIGMAHHAHWFQHCSTRDSFEPQTALAECMCITGSMVGGRHLLRGRALRGRRPCRPPT